MVAGSVGTKLSTSNKEIDSFNAVQPGTRWWMYKARSEEEILEEAKQKYEKLREEYRYSSFPEWQGKETYLKFERYLSRSD
jgi:hypothetical protein